MNSENKPSLLGLTCREASRLISESLDRDLTRRERWALRLHTVLCSACKKFARQTEWIRSALANAPDSLRGSLIDINTKLSAKRRAQINRLLSEARQADPPD